MRFDIIWSIYRKEIMDSLRDRLTLLVVLALPLLLYPLLIIGMSKLIDTQVAEQEMRASKVAVWGEMPPSLLEWLKKTNSLTIEEWTGTSASLREDLQSGRLHPPPSLTRTNQSSGLKKRASITEAEVEKENPVLEAARSVITKRELDAVLVVWPGFSNALAADGLRKGNRPKNTVLTDPRARA